MTGSTFSLTKYLYTTMSTKKRKEYFKIFLSQRLDELLTEAKKTASGIADFSDESPNFTDEASIESDRNLVFRIRERESKLMRKIEHALKKLEDGTFGICEECGEEISEQRLRARPIATLCISNRSRAGMLLSTLMSPTLVFPAT